MKAFRYILYGLVIAGAGGLLLWQGLVEKNLESGDLIRGGLIIAAAVIGMLKPQRQRRVSNKKVVYQKAYGEFIQNAFADESKLEKRFYDAVDDYNFSRYAAGLDKLNKLRGECRNTAELYAVTVFMALCCDGMQANEDAVRHYQAALAIRDNSTLHSNVGICCMRMGDYAQAESALHKALQSDPNNATAWNNLSVLCFRQGDYTASLEHAKHAIAIDPKLAAAHSGAALCCALLGDREQYEYYYRQAVANGYDGRKIKNAVKAFDPTL